VPEDRVERMRGVEGVARSRRGARAGAGARRPDRPAPSSPTVLLGHLDGANVGRVLAREPTLEDAYVALVDER
jgi:ABC-2 type transport system ATP-binding protein